jgi:hypothetical protein
MSLVLSPARLSLAKWHKRTNLGGGQDERVEAVCRLQGNEPVEEHAFPLGRDQKHFRSGRRQSS